MYNYFITNRYIKFVCLFIAITILACYSYGRISHDDISKALLYDQGWLLNICLIKYPDMINSKVDDNDTLLHYAVLTNKYDCVKVLLKSKANLRAMNIEGQLPIYGAIVNDNVKILNLFLASGFKIDEKCNREGALPIEIAAQIGSPRVAQRLLYLSGMDIRKKLFWVDVNSIALYAAANCGRCNHVKDTIQKNLIENDYSIIIGQLLQNGADPDRIYEDSGDSSIFCAIKGDHLIIVKRLISHGAMVNIRNLNGITPLQLSIQKKYDDISNFLKNNEAII